ncbi:hypothetical protein ACI3K4_23365 [Streptomyces sp. CSMPJR101]|uniref:hypothetical protein n=1 Tax=Streptomyces sp. CSMPJR101 TaxID=1279378 RepID=UPI0038525950
MLSRWGVPADHAAHLVEQAIGGRFHSWTGPDPALVEDIAERIADTVRPDAIARSGQPAPPDHLQRWLAVRESVPWREAADSTGNAAVTPVRDGMADEIRTFDAILDPARAQNLLTALYVMRADAARGARLDFALIQRWQQHVLAAPALPPLRSLPAFAKGGRERYGITPDTRARLDACLAGSAKDTIRPLPLTARAARAFLDVCFFHPFDDGNARRALLTPFSSYSPAKTSPSTACACYVGSPSTPTPHRTHSPSLATSTTTYANPYTEPRTPPLKTATASLRPDCPWHRGT